MIQPLPSAAAVERLNQNLGRLSRSPQDVQALLGAGQAALELGDVQAANGFFTRANMVAPNNGQAKLGLAVVSIALKQANDAAAYFDQAAALGADARDYLTERGLAYDLTGQQAKAQQDYQAALRANPADATARLRYAISLGIAGHVADAEAQLQPALAAQDREAWRARAFVLAMNGRVADARKITQTVMPRGLADALDPYIARVGLLTPGQKAAAVHYGDFPAEVLRAAAPTAPVVVAERTDTSSGKGRTSARNRNRQDDQGGSPVESAAARARDRAAQREAAASAPVRTASAPATTPVTRTPTPAPAPSPTPASVPTPAPVVPQPATTQRVASAATARPDAATPRPVSTPPSESRPAQVVQNTRGEAAPATPGFSANAAPMSAGVQGPADPATFTSASPQPTPSVRPVPATPAPAAAEQPTRSLADVMAGLGPSEGEHVAGPAPVDLAAVARIQAERRKIQEEVAAKAAAEKAKRDAAAKAKAEAAAKAKAEAEEKKRLADNPARIWVQIATGRDVAALGFDLRRMRRTYADALGSEAGWTAEWGATRRLLIGPYASAAKARDAAAAIKKSGGDAFVWNSEAGEDVTKIGGK